MACPKSSPFIAAGEDGANDESVPVSALTFRDEDQPYGWPEIA